MVPSGSSTIALILSVLYLGKGERDRVSQWLYVVALCVEEEEGRESAWEEKMQVRRYFSTVS